MRQCQCRCQYAAAAAAAAVVQLSLWDQRVHTALFIDRYSTGMILTVFSGHSSSIRLVSVAVHKTILGHDRAL